MHPDKPRDNCFLYFHSGRKLLIGYPHPIFPIFLNEDDFLFTRREIVAYDYLVPVSFKGNSRFRNDKVPVCFKLLKEQISRQGLRKGKSSLVCHTLNDTIMPS